ncbi:bifunctional diguanylate cyclase/phosphodiesterase [Erythrobacter sp. HKB08]|uniref:putative bifunctional diguanylate cyclase/phosphodiesterase n=1 Tax=Erythrobacter sp. HKB08 TaxID=2502843 RepID=UPI001F48D91E|nr:GGDEF and EAL domain-containing protein [Erythrobacter sp. HKB08]
MSKNPSDLPSLPGSLPALAVLGIKSPATGDWQRLRGLQYASMRRPRPVRVLGQAVGAVLIGWITFALVHPALIAAWLGYMVFAIWQVQKTVGVLFDADMRKIRRCEIRNHTLATLATSVGWALPLVAVAIVGTPNDFLLCWIVLATLITGSAMFQAALPQSTAIFATTLTIVGVAVALVTAQFVIVPAIVLFWGLVMGGTIGTARMHLKGRIAEAGMAEKNEVVSLLLREFEENQGDWLWQIDTNRRVRTVSPRFSYALGRPPEEVEGMPFMQLIAGDAWQTGQFAPSLHDLAERLKRRENFSNLIVKVAINGENRWWELSGTPILDESGNYMGFRGVGSDVTEQRESSEKIAYLARYDTLTGLPNRLMLNEALRDALKFSEQWRTRCAFLMLDLDRFKAVNDSLGHMVGDKLLAEVSTRLKELTDENAMCGRLGGDEFAVVIRDASEKGCIERLAKKIIARLSQPYDIDNHTLYVGASVGSAIGPRDGKTVEELMRNADLALYRGKDEGGGEHFAYEPSFHAHAEERRQLEFSLRRAIERKELVLNFQPVVSATTEELVSFEALVRWNSSDHGFVSPGKFIPLAEDTRLIVPIGTWVLEQACLEAMRWPSHVRIAVNVSGEQLVEPEFTNTVVRALSKSGLEAARLEIEVTESIFLRDADVARAALEQVMALGCTVALDDFGTGYSSLGYLRKLSFSTIKVDRTFVQGAAQNSAESLAIIRAVVAMADSLGMTTTAEGAESPEQVELIRKLGCTKIQGYYFGRPMPSEEVMGMFRHQSAASA